MMLLDLAVKATVLIALGSALTWMMRHTSAASRHAVWTTIFVALLLLPWARMVVPEWSIAFLPSGFMQGGDVATAVPVIEPDAGGGAVRPVDVARWPAWLPGWSVAAILIAVWGAGIAVRLGWIAAGLVGTLRLDRQAQPINDPRLRVSAERAARCLGVVRPIRLLSVSNDFMPVTWGLRSPRVLLPAVAERWTDDQLAAVLTHELSHVVRKDTLSHLIARLATALWWWHPLAWMAARQARFERERACDDLVLTMGARASDYAADLVAFVASLRPPVAASATMAMARRSQLEGRVMAILESGVNRRGVSQAGVLAAMLVMVLVWPLAAARPAATAQEPQQPIRVGGNVKPPVKTKDVRPIYPESARAEGRRGVAIIEALVGVDGTVTNTKVVRSIGEDLDAAAVDAVSQWEFEPTTLNGIAVPVLMTVTVNFTLGDATPPPPPPPTPVGADAPPPPPPAPAPAWSPGDPPVRIGGSVMPPKKIKDVSPVYPQDAQEAKVSGVVIIEARIDQDGRVTDARVIRNVAMLDQAALDAVLQWEFEPTHLNGVPVPVIMTVTVNFTLK
jgi:TonB family protein